jgi:hypothetical protein
LTRQEPLGRSPLSTRTSRRSGASPAGHHLRRPLTGHRPRRTSRHRSGRRIPPLRQAVSAILLTPSGDRNSCTVRGT